MGAQLIVTKPEAQKKYFKGTSLANDRTRAPPQPCPANSDIYGIFQNPADPERCCLSPEHILGLIPALSGQGEHAWMSQFMGCP